MYSIKMTEKTLKIGNAEVNKENHSSKKPIALNLVDIDKTVISDKFKHNDKGSKYSFGYTDDNIIRPLFCLCLKCMGT